MNRSRVFSGLMILACCVATACDKPTLSIVDPVLVPSQSSLIVDELTLTVEQAEQTLVDAGLKLGEPIEHGALKIVPIVSHQPRADDLYIGLDQGLQAGTVEVFETGAQSGGSGGNQVNRVLVINRSDKPLYLMPGEIILGGDQDRSISQECVIPVGAKPTAVPVFCVEHGRWGNRTSSSNSQLLAQVAENSDSELAEDVSAIETLSKKGDQDQFMFSPTVASKSVRVAVEKSANQSKVWEEVAKVNAKSGAQSASGSLTANYTQKETTERLEPYRKALREPVAEIANIVGVAVVIHGKTEAVDVFRSTPLFKKLWPKLLEGYALDAATYDEPSEGIEHEQNDSVRFIAQVLQQSKPSSPHQGAATRRGTVAASDTSGAGADAYEAEQSAMPLHVSGFSAEPESETP